MARKKGLNFYYDWESPLSKIPTEEFKPFVLAMLSYEQGKIDTVPLFNSIQAQMAAEFVFPQIERAITNAENGRNGGLKKQKNPIGNTDGNTDGSGIDSTTNTITNTNTNTNTNILPSAKADLTIFEKEFEELWDIYPRKVGKTNALKSYIKARKSGTTYEDVARGINAYNEHIKATGTKDEFIKHGSTWFNQCSWNDEYGIKNTPFPTTEQDNWFTEALKGGDY